MRKVSKNRNSKILKLNVKYKQGDNSKLSQLLYEEQKGFCAYTEEYIGRADAKDIEHFNPSLKNTNKDNYLNWFLVKHQWNKEKSTKWDIFQPILHPTDANFEQRIVYHQGDYIVSRLEDLEAKNLIALLKLDDAILADERKRYIKRKKEEIAIFGETPESFFQTLIAADIKQIAYLRAIQEEFNLDIWELIP